jgi:hypothetical protein
MKTKRSKMGVENEAKRDVWWSGWREKRHELSVEGDAEGRTRSRDWR